MEGGALIYQHDSYRSYLGAFYKVEKELRPTFSFRSFARKAKLGSPNYLKLVIDGKRRISEKKLSLFIKGLGLKQYEAAYFVTMVHLEHSKDSELKGLYKKELERLKALGTQPLRMLSEEDRKNLSHWESWAIRELFAHKEAKFDLEWVQGKLAFKTGIEKVSKCLESLLKAGLLVQNQEGKLKIRDPIYATGDQLGCEYLRSLYQEFFELAQRAVKEIPTPKRRLGGLTLALRNEDVPKVMKHIENFISELNRKYSLTQDADEIYHLACAFFPLSTETYPNKNQKSKEPK